jgi:hypothetical protein
MDSPVNTSDPLRVRVILGGAGVLLLVAAGLKLYGWNVSPFAQYGWLLSPAVQTVAVGWELFLGVWLLSGTARRWAWVFALLTFTAFALVSGYLGIIGQANCGCFGVIQASPWVAFGVDIAVLALLVLARPRAESADAVGLRWVGGVAAVLVALLATSFLIFGSAEAAVAKLRGQTLTNTSHLDFGTGTPGTVATATATVHNWTDAPLRLIGGTSDCSCLATQDLPITIPPNGSVEVSVKLKIPAGTPGQLTRSVEFLTDCPKHPRLRLTAGAMVE